MLKEIKLKYKNITYETITIYLSLCRSCEMKKGTPKKGLVVRPILSSELNSRCQVDLVDMQSSPDNEFKFIMVYQDHMTKFVHLKALKSKTAVEVAHHLLDIFLLCGAPSILQSDKGREFANKIIVELCSMWTDVKIVHGKPRHSQSQGSVERANQDVQNMINAWMLSNNSDKWSEGLRSCNFQKTHHTMKVFDRRLMKRCLE